MESVCPVSISEEWSWTISPHIRLRNHTFFQSRPNRTQMVGWCTCLRYCTSWRATSPKPETMRWCGTILTDNINLDLHCERHQRSTSQLSWREHYRFIRLQRMLMLDNLKFMKWKVNYSTGRGGKTLLPRACRYVKTTKACLTDEAWPVLDALPWCPLSDVLWVSPIWLTQKMFDDKDPLFNASCLVTRRGLEFRSRSPETGHTSTARVHDIEDVRQLDNAVLPKWTS